MVTMPAVDLSAGDLAHGVVEGQAEHLDVEVDGVAAQIPLRPAPITVFHILPLLIIVNPIP